MKSWLITDTHFFHDMHDKMHDNMVEFCGRPKDHTESIMAHWREMVGWDDVIIHMGDILLGSGRKQKLKGIMATLPGRKILVRGNHDKESLSWYMDNGFLLAVEGMLYRDIWITHRPALSLPDGAVVNIHGHHHNNGHRSWEFEPGKPEPWHHLLAIENTDYRPVDLEKFVQTNEVYKRRLTTSSSSPI